VFRGCVGGDGCDEGFGCEYFTYFRRRRRVFRFLVPFSFSYFCFKPNLADGVLSLFSHFHQTLLPSLLLPLTTLTPTSPRSQPFLLTLLRTILLLLQTSLRTSSERVEGWRGKVLGGLGRLWVGIREGEVLEGEGEFGKEGRKGTKKRERES